jgi:hypothetical protein
MAEAPDVGVGTDHGRLGDLRDLLGKRRRTGDRLLDGEQLVGGIRRILGSSRAGRWQELR